jgi:glucose/arabinose dehydrogenase
VHFSARHDFRVDTIAMFDHPWSLSWLPNGDMLVVERPGRLRIVRDGKQLPDPVAGVPKVYLERGQGGLMDVLPHPKFAQNHLVYLAYAKTVRDTLGANAIARGRLEGDRLVDVQDIYVSRAAHPRNNQWGGKMVFDSSGYLFLAVGDRQFPPQLMEKHPAQDLTSGFGTIVRLRDDGSIPDDNPFVARADVPHELWSWGHRNQQGLALDPRTHELWETEHGPRGGDELNRVLPGRNYGWPVVSYGVDYDGKPFTKETHREGIESPVWTWIPSIAPSGLVFYTGDRFPWWKGSLFAGGLEGQVLVRITLDGDQMRSAETLLLGDVGRIRDVREGPDGLLYLAIDPPGNAATPVVRLSPVQGDVQPPPGR